MTQVLPLKGYRSLKALNGFHALLLGMKMLPMYVGVSYVDFYESFKTKTDSEKETLLREAVAFVELSQDEVDAMLSFCVDDNGVPFFSGNSSNLDIAQIHECIVAVCLEIGRIKITLVTEEEKKRLQTLASTSGESTHETQT